MRDPRPVLTDRSGTTAPAGADRRGRRRGGRHVPHRVAPPRDGPRRRGGAAVDVWGCLPGDRTPGAQHRPAAPAARALAHARFGADRCRRRRQCQRRPSTASSCRVGPVSGTPTPRFCAWWRGNGSPSSPSPPCSGSNRRRRAQRLHRARRIWPASTTGCSPARPQPPLLRQEVPGDHRGRGDASARRSRPGSRNAAPARPSTPPATSTPCARRAATWTTSTPSQHRPNRQAPAAAGWRRRGGGHCGHHRRRTRARSPRRRRVGGRVRPGTAGWRRTGTVATEGPVTTPPAWPPPPPSKTPERGWVSSACPRRERRRAPRRAVNSSCRFARAYDRRSAGSASQRDRRVAAARRALRPRRRTADLAEVRGSSRGCELAVDGSSRTASHA